MFTKCPCPASTQDPRHDSCFGPHHLQVSRRREARVRRKLLVGPRDGRQPKTIQAARLVVTCADYINTIFPNTIFSFRTTRNLYWRLPSLVTLLTFIDYRLCINCFLLASISVNYSVTLSPSKDGAVTCGAESCGAETRGAETRGAETWRFLIRRGIRSGLCEQHHKTAEELVEENVHQCKVQ